MEQLLPRQKNQWVLNYAYGINDNGRVVGVGTYNGQQAGFLLYPN